MASFASTRVSCGVPSTSGRMQHLKPTKLNHRQCLRTHASAAAVAATRLAVAESPAEYAVISTPRGQQLVEEGKWFALCSESVLKASSEDGQLRFPAVAVKRADGEFVKGQLASGWVVEAQLVDEQAFALPAGTSSSLLGKVLVTKIKHTEETLLRIEEALRA